MKKIIAMLLALVMVLSLAACGGEKAPRPPLLLLTTMNPLLPKVALLLPRRLA